MDTNIIAVVTALAALVIFLCLVTVLKYAIRGNFTRTRVILTLLLVFLVAVVLLAFWQYIAASATTMFTTFLLGILVGERAGVRPAQRKIAIDGVQHYMEHYITSNKDEIKTLTWWGLVNFYAIMCALIMMNLIGLSRILFEGNRELAIAVVALGTFLIGTIVPYIIHLWRVHYENN
jgi:hypothetical protein